MRKIIVLILVGLFVMVFSMPVFAEIDYWGMHKKDISNVTQDTVDAARDGDPEAMVKLGVRCMINKQPSEGLYYFNKAVSKGYPWGCFFLALWYQDRAQFETDPVKKDKLLQIALAGFTYDSVSNYCQGCGDNKAGMIYRYDYQDNGKAADYWIRAYLKGFVEVASSLYDISDVNKKANIFLKSRGLKCKDFVAEEAAPPATVGASAKVVEQSKQVPVVKKAPGVFKFPGKDEVFEIELRNGRKIPGKVKDIVENKVYFELGEGAVTIYKQENIAMSSRCRLFKEDFLNQAQ